MDGCFDFQKEKKGDQEQGLNMFQSNDHLLSDRSYITIYQFMIFSKDAKLVCISDYGLVVYLTRINTFSVVPRSGETMLYIYSPGLYQRRWEF